MKFLFSLCAFLMTTSLLATTVTSSIESIEKGAPHEADIVRLSNGEVVFIDPSRSRKDFREALFAKGLQDEAVRFTLSKNRSVLSMESVPAPLQDAEWDVAPESFYDPTPVSYSTSQIIFKKMRRDWQNQSQCYNRAHIWAYEEFKRTGNKTMKLFLFFTSRYIRNYRYHWWFHVTPAAVLNDGSWRTLDRRYSSGPLQLKTWTDKFIYSRRSCPVVYRYSDYRLNQNSQDCYLIPVSMYYWQPRDIERNERTGYEKQSFIKSEINHAYWEAF